MRIAPWTWILGILWLAQAGCAGTATPGAGSDRGRPSSSPHPSVPAASEPLRVRVANRDPAGVERQPDYDGIAARLAARIGPKLPEVPDPAGACRKMADAARDRYARTIPDPQVRARVLAELDATRTEDIEGCQASLTGKAAACAEWLLREENAEYDLAVDRCARAFPAPRP